ncbi:MAG: rod shape-determining protein MreC [Gemmatimonadota bacterium]|nr:rod shape-determining protein MreC [Gemmatimonadota bacterium]
MRYPTIDRPGRKRRDFGLVAGLCAVSLLLANLGEVGRLTVLRGLRATVLAPVLAVHRGYERGTGLARQVEELTAERDSLARQVAAAADLAEENHRLRALVGLPERLAETFVTGEITPGAAGDVGPHTFLFRTSSDVRLTVPAGVRSPKGLVGVLRARRAGSALGEFWTHPDFRVAARVSEGDATGIVRPFRVEAGESLMLLEGAPFQAEIPAGTRVVTSGIGGVHAPGIPVGTILREGESRSGWSRSYVIRPAVQPGYARVGLAWIPEPLDGPPVAPPEPEGGP